MYARPLILFVALMAPLSCFAVTVYKSVDTDGNVSYSDTPPAGGQTAESIQITEYATGLSAEDMTRLQSMRFIDRNLASRSLASSFGVFMPLT